MKNKICVLICTLCISSHTTPRPLKVSAIQMTDYYQLWTHQAPCGVVALRKAAEREGKAPILDRAIANLKAQLTAEAPSICSWEQMYKLAHDARLRIYLLGVSHDPRKKANPQNYPYIYVDFQDTSRAPIFILHDAGWHNTINAPAPVPSFGNRDGVLDGFALDIFAAAQRDGIRFIHFLCQVNAGNLEHVFLITIDREQHTLFVYQDPGLLHNRSNDRIVDSYVNTLNRLYDEYDQSIATQQEAQQVTPMPVSTKVIKTDERGIWSEVRDDRGNFLFYMLVDNKGRMHRVQYFGQFLEF